MLKNTKKQVKSILMYFTYPNIPKISFEYMHVCVRMCVERERDGREEKVTLRIVS